MSDNEICAKAVRRAELSGVDAVLYRNVVIFLEKEIDMYRDKIEKLLNEKEVMKTRINSICGVSLPKAVQENTTTEIIKALSDNGYNTITINAYKEC